MSYGNEAVGGPGVTEMQTTCDLAQQLLGYSHELVATLAEIDRRMFGAAPQTESAGLDGSPKNQPHLFMQLNLARGALSEARNRAIDILQRL